MLRAAVALAALAGALALAAAGNAGSASAQTVSQQARSDDLAMLRTVGVPAAWRVSQGSGVIVAVLDTGVNASATDLAGTVTTGPDYTAGADPAGYQPPHLHGTYIASIIAGHGSGAGRAGGVIGVAPKARILSVRVILDDQEPGFAVYNENAEYYDAIGEGIRYAVAHGAGVINMSLGSTVATRSTRLALAYALARGVVVVAAAGNDGSSHPGFTPYSYPASFTGVISVAAVTASGRRASFSDRNASVVVAAPGVNVVGDGPAGSFLVGSGTSPASAIVAGVAALIRSKYPRLTPAQVVQAIVSSAQRRPDGGYSPGVGFGEVDAAAALTAAGGLALGHPAGLAPAAHFGPGPGGPIVVARRDSTLIAALFTVAAAGAAGFVAAIAVLVRRHRRRRKPSRSGSVQSGPARPALP
jgi:type VII secretion-associated serine protease mycosin